MPPPGRTTVHEPTDEEARARARERVARTARAGQAPSTAYSEADLEWAFGGAHEAELVELEELAAQAPAAEAERVEQLTRSREFQAMVARVLEEWEREREAELRAKAEVEARRRLGWKRGEQP
jgi:hypothetical protein